jgi:cbb3-type cytochrome oxidase subunit 1
MDHSKASRQILSFSVATSQDHQEAIEQLSQLARMAEAGLIEGMAVRTVQEDGEVSYQSFGAVNAEDWTHFVMHCVSGR